MDSALTDSTAQEHWDDRTVTLIGREGAGRLVASRVLVAGAGGVGGYAIEMLARSGVGHITIIDSDGVTPSNINRQIIALRSTVGKPKTTLFTERIRDINPRCSVTALQTYITPDNVSSLLTADGGYDFVIDAIDTVAPKCALILECLNRRIPVISSMGAGGRTDPSKVRYGDLWDTREDGLARAVRQRLKKVGRRLPVRVVCSDETPKASAVVALDLPNKRSSFGTLATIPSLFGIYLASHVINHLAKVHP